MSKTSNDSCFSEDSNPLICNHVFGLWIQIDRTRDEYGTLRQEVFERICSRCNGFEKKTVKYRERHLIREVVEEAAPTTLRG